MMEAPITTPITYYGHSQCYPVHKKSKGSLKSKIVYYIYIFKSMLAELSSWFHIKAYENSHDLYNLKGREV